MALFVTCVVDVFEPNVGLAAVRLLRAAGCDVSFNQDQTCCGQPAWNSGFADDAARVAGTTLAALEAEVRAGAEWVVAPAGSCTTMVKVFWPELFEAVEDHDAARRARAIGERTLELSQFLADRPLPHLELPRPERVAYHHSCHLLRELGGHQPPVELLDRLNGCDTVRWDDDERCCGFGGLFSFKLPETAEAMADEKLASLSVVEPAPDTLVSADSSCLVHLRGRAAATGRPVRTRHLAELLADGLPP